MLPWQPNKMATGYQTDKLGRQSSNYHKFQIWFTSIQWLWRKCNVTIFPLKAYGSFLLPWQPNQGADHHNLSYFRLPLIKQHLYQIRVILLQWFWRSYHLKNSFFKIECCHGNQTNWPLVIKHINWVDNLQMIITVKYGSHHFSGYGENTI